MIENLNNSVGLLILRKGRKRKSRARNLEKRCFVVSSGNNGCILLSPEGTLYYVVD